MTTTDAQAALDRIEADEAFAKQVKDAGGPEKSLALLRAQGFDVSPDEIRDAVLDRYSEQLTPEQLDALAGGIHTDSGEAYHADPLIGTVIGASVAAGTVVIGAAAAAVV